MGKIHGPFPHRAKEVIFLMADHVEQEEVQAVVVLLASLQRIARGDSVPRETLREQVDAVAAFPEMETHWRAILEQYLAKSSLLTSNEGSARVQEALRDLLSSRMSCLQSRSVWVFARAEKV